MGEQKERGDGFNFRKKMEGITFSQSLCLLFQHLFQKEPLSISNWCSLDDKFYDHLNYTDYQPLYLTLFLSLFLLLPLTQTVFIYFHEQPCCLSWYVLGYETVMSWSSFLAKLISVPLLTCLLSLLINISRSWET